MFSILLAMLSRVRLVGMIDDGRRFNKMMNMLWGKEWRKMEEASIGLIGGSHRSLR